ncbi:MAG: DUF721 domain-containing protein, partial [Sandaracinaceae bacterium]|nr:DUF721 domain-containing protein [Sandaracinaceae bacterium]
MKERHVDQKPTITSDQPELLANLLNSLIAKERKSDFRFFQVFSWWLRHFPEQIVKNARPIRLRRNTLEVGARSAGWAHEISMMSTELMRLLHSAFPQLEIRGLRVRVANLPELPNWVFKEKFKSQLPGSLPEEIYASLAMISDERLRAAFKSA